jgi:hypothetical protein
MTDNFKSITEKNRRWIYLKSFEDGSIAGVIDEGSGIWREHRWDADGKHKFAIGVNDPKRIPDFDLIKIAAAEKGA